MEEEAVKEEAVKEEAVKEEVVKEEVVKEGEVGTDEAGENLVEDQKVEGEQVEGEHVTGEHGDVEHVSGEEVDGEHMEGEYAEGEQMEGEHLEGEGKEAVLGEGEELVGEGLEGEIQGEEKEDVEVVEAVPEVEEIVEEEYVEPPPDPAAPYNFRDSAELLRPKYELRPDQLAEVEQIWAYFQDYTPSYTDIKDYITIKELIYMLKALLLMTHTPEQLDELIEFCVRPPHPEGHITFDQFKYMVVLRQRDFPVEEELRIALQVFDPEKSGMVMRDELKEVLSKQGHKMPQKQLDNLIKEVDIMNDGTLGVEDIVGTMCIDLNPEDLIMMRNAVYNPDANIPKEEEEF